MIFITKLRTTSLFTSLCIGFSYFAMAQEIDIPDPAFLSDLIINGVDVNMDGQIQLIEAENAEYVFLSNPDIESIEGIEYFRSLKELELSFIGFIDSLNLSQNDSLVFLNINDTEFDYLDVKSCTNLFSFSINNDVSLSRPLDIDLSENAQLDIVEIYVSMIENLKFGNNSALTTLMITNNSGLESLDLRGCFNLITIHIDNAPQLKEINLSDSEALIDVILLETSIDFLNLSNNPGIDILIVDRGIQFIDIKNNTLLTAIDLQCTANDRLEAICIDEEILPIIELTLETCGTLPEVEVLFECFPLHQFTQSLQLIQFLDTLSNGDCTAMVDSPFNMLLEIHSMTNDTAVYNGYRVDQSSGYYALPKDQLRITPILGPLNSNYSITQTEFELDFSNNEDLTEEICFTATNANTDVAIDLFPIDDARPGFEANYILRYRNIGATTSNGRITVNYPDETVTFISASEEVEEDQGMLNFQYDNLKPFEERDIFLTFILNTPTDINPLDQGDFLNFNAFIFPDVFDILRDDNFTILSQEVINSFDPNDKTCFQGATLMDTLVGRSLDYRIRFENIGTASAVHVFIDDEIDTTYFDINSLRVTEASHDLQTTIDGNLVQFSFRDIYLPYEDAFNDGYVIYKIKTKDDLQIGDTIKNQASIVFDFNAPIITNVAETIIVTDADGDGFHNLEDCDDASANINPDAEEIPGNDIDEDCDGEILTSTHEVQALHFMLYPNPAQDVIHIQKFTTATLQIKIFNLTGEMILKTGNVSSLDLSTLVEGMYLMEIEEEATGNKGSRRFVVY